MPLTIEIFLKLLSSLSQEEVGGFQNVWSKSLIQLIGAMIRFNCRESMKKNESIQICFPVHLERLCAQTSA